MLVKNSRRCIVICLMAAKSIPYRKKKEEEMSRNTAVSVVLCVFIVFVFRALVGGGGESTDAAAVVVVERETKQPLKKKEMPSTHAQYESQEEVRPAPAQPSPPPLPRVEIKHEIPRVAADGSTERPPYHEYWMGALHRELGPLISKAIYDPQMFVEAVKNPSGYLTILPLQYEPPAGGYRELNTFGKQLLLVKRSLSLALGRMHRDVGLAQTYATTAGDPAAFALFDKAVSSFIWGQARHYHILLQMFIDASPRTTRQELLKASADQNTRFGGQDAVWFICSKVSASTSDAEATELLKGLATMSAPQRATPMHPAEKVLTFDYTNHPFSAQEPKVQKFYSIVRPTATCHNLQRECEDPDGCRFICNLHYLQNKLQDGEPFGHRFLGLGSNNQYEWEMSLLKVFGQSGRFTTPNTVHSISTFDCTLRSGFRPPQSLISAPVGWGAASICLGSETKDKFISFHDLKKAVLDSETTGPHEVRPDAGGERRKIQRYKMGSSAGVPGSAFDDVSLFKMDIERFEFHVVPSWSQSELEAVGNNAELLGRLKSTDGPITMIDFHKELKFFSVSQFLIEIHVIGKDFDWLWKLEFLVLQMHQLGFVMVLYEKNYRSNSCYEMVFVHYRYYVRSEMFTGENARN